MALNTPEASQLLRRAAAPASKRALSTETRAAIDRAVSSAPVVLFMKGTPETPQCGFSRATVQILGLQGVDPAKFAAFNVLEDSDLRSGKHLPNRCTSSPRGETSEAGPEDLGTALSRDRRQGREKDAT